MLKSSYFAVKTNSSQVKQQFHTLERVEVPMNTKARGFAEDPEKIANISVSRKLSLKWSIAWTDAVARISMALELGDVVEFKYCER